MVPIDASVNGHMLYRGEHAKAHFCKTCGEPRYRSSIAPDGKVTYMKDRKARKVFLHFPLIESLREMYRDPDFVKNVDHPHRHFKKHKEGYHRDLYDGELYYEFMDVFGMLGDDGRPNMTADVWRQNICLSLSHDGIVPHEASSHQFWAYQVKVLHLPPSMRVKYRWMRLVGLIPGPKKASAFAIGNVYVQPLMEDLEQLYHGVELCARAKHCMTHGEKLTARGCIMTIVGYGRAHGAGTNVQSGGARRCVYCEDVGHYVGDLDKHVYPPKPRTHLKEDDNERNRTFYETKETGSPPPLRTVRSLRCVVCNLLKIS